MTATIPGLIGLVPGQDTDIGASVPRDCGRGRQRRRCHPHKNALRRVMVHRSFRWNMPPQFRTSMGCYHTIHSIPSIEFSPVEEVGIIKEGEQIFRGGGFTPSHAAAYRLTTGADAILICCWLLDQNTEMDGPSPARIERTGKGPANGTFARYNWFFNQTCGQRLRQSASRGLQEGCEGRC